VVTATKNELQILLMLLSSIQFSDYGTIIALKPSLCSICSTLEGPFESYCSV